LAKGDKSLFTASLYLMAATMVLNLSMVVYHRVMSGNLGQGYAQLAAVIGVINLVGVVTNGLGTYLAKVYARDMALAGPGCVRARFISHLPLLGVIILAVGTLMAVAQRPVVEYLKLDTAGIYWLALALVVGSLVLAVVRAALQGLHRFGVLGSSFIAEGVGRVVFAAAMVFQGQEVAGALRGSFYGALVGLGVAGCGMLGLGPALRLDKAPAEKGWLHRLAELSTDTVALGLFSLLCFLDLFEAKHYWPEAMAADYSRMALVAKAFLYAGSALVLVMLPVVSAARAKGQDTRPLLLKFLAAHTALLLAGLAAVWVMTPWIIHLLCGPQESFTALAPMVRWFCLAVVPLALAQLVLLYHLALGRRLPVLLLALVTAGYYGLLERFHARPGQLVASLGLASTLALLSGLTLALGPWGGKASGGLDEDESLAVALQDRAD
jgi:hypothetical protein